MDHIAIMKKSWNLIPMILDGTKTIESRWYKAKIAPWDRIKQGDTVYFKNSGEPVTAKAQVEKVLQFADLAQEKVKEIYELYGEAIGAKRDEIARWVEDKVGKKYCILIFLTNAEKIEPFGIDKTGFGNAAAWICVDDVKKLIIYKYNI